MRASLYRFRNGESTRGVSPRNPARLTGHADRGFNAGTEAGMDVANPIYDVVFKYLMQDQRVARLPTS